MKPVNGVLTELGMAVAIEELRQRGRRGKAAHLGTRSRQFLLSYPPRVAPHSMKISMTVVVIFKSPRA